MTLFEPKKRVKIPIDGGTISFSVPADADMDLVKAEVLECQKESQRLRSRSEDEKIKDDFSQYYHELWNLFYQIRIIRNQLSDCEDFETIKSQIYMLPTEKLSTPFSDMGMRFQKERRAIRCLGKFFADFGKIIESSQ